MDILDIFSYKPSTSNFTEVRLAGTALIYMRTDGQVDVWTN